MSKQSQRWAVYGASGTSGQHLVGQAVARGHAPLLLGRHAERTAAVAVSLGLEWQAIPLSERGRLVACLQDVDLLFNAAGPFVETWRPLAEACLAAQTHYLDLSSEIPVFEGLRTLHKRALDRGVALLPGAGFLTVGTEGLARHVLRCLPSASEILVGLSRTPRFSEGTRRTVLASASGATRIRRQGLWLSPPLGYRRRTFDFGHGSAWAVAMPFGDLISIAESTGVPNLEVCIEVSLAEWWGLRCVRPLSAPGPSRWLGRAWLEHRRLTAMLDPVRHRRSIGQTIVVQASDPRGRNATSRLWTPDSYTFTTDAALRLIEALLANDRSHAGFLTPAQILSIPSILGLSGVCHLDES